MNRMKMCEMRDDSANDHLDRRGGSRKEERLLTTDKNQFAGENDTQGRLVTIIERFGQIQNKDRNETDRGRYPINIFKQRTDQFYIELRQFKSTRNALWTFHTEKRRQLTGEDMQSST